MTHHHSSHGLATLLDRDARVLSEFLTEVTTWFREVTGAQPRPRIADIGAGTGSGTVALARAFPGSRVTAIDRTPDMLTRVRDRARDTDVAAAVDTLLADVNAGWPLAEPIDAAWASASLHEMTDPGRVLSEIRAGLRPGGVLAVIEMNEPPRFLPRELGLGEPGFEDRLRLAAARARRGPNAHPDWTDLLAEAGLDQVATRVFNITVPGGPENPAVAELAELYFAQIAGGARPGLSAEDAAVLDLLLAPEGPHALSNRTDLEFRGPRTAWVVRRPVA
ncbi:class I SAM-dependent methyltransferase [Mycetocola spongiae]|uniref:class I SAM-dependent methyltransferase n=1 Tax=Mycetocola spongiae TaxID=2859226 RepID=UPI001CF2DB59|nr:class I SAM-dependent methyltransferase [Mycetocola spongiae]UCR88167.1 class I SAM-dependent methyltransferase [Mycetocola spongiae]